MSWLPTYRLQLDGTFGFEEAAQILDYLDRLGVGSLYLSPVLQARPGSTHGYDVVDHSRISDDLGGDSGLRRLAAALSSRGMGQIVDIVPNHMAADAVANQWWRDVMENGPSSRYSAYFDIDWTESPTQDDGSQPTVLVPILGDHYGRVIEAGEIQLTRRGGSFVVRYHEHEFPVSPRTVDGILDAAAEYSGSEGLRDLSVAFAALPEARRTDRTAVIDRHTQSQSLRSELDALCRAEQSVAAAIDDAMSAVNSDPDRIDALLRRQNYRLARWRNSSEELDYRRFFNIESLVALRVEDEDAFADSHELILRLIGEGVVNGLRVDHIDGLRDPFGYLQRLRKLSGTYTVVEKILARGETLPSIWPVEGTTGYEFIAAVQNLLVDPAAERPLHECYSRVTGETSTYAEVVTASKHQVLEGELRPELDRLTRHLAEICDKHRRHRDHTQSELRYALSEILVAFPVYRIYSRPDLPVSPFDRQCVDVAVAAVRQVGTCDPELLQFISELLMGEWPGADESSFALSFPQTSAPLMAKGVEDTAFYRYNRLISLNEVGGDPSVFGRPVGEFHDRCAAAAGAWPHAMLTLSTHDTKRSADVRARINLLSELPDRWEEAVTRWFEVTERHVSPAGPDRNARYVFFQTIVGAWPIATVRMEQYMDKVAKEAKVWTSWTEPDPAYDEALASFVRRSLDDAHFTAAVDSFLSYNGIPLAGRTMSLVQQALLLTCPGRADIYQGSELWDNRLVDPDNRTKVDYEQRRTVLSDVLEGGTAPALASDASGAAKVWLTSRLLQHRRRHPDWYAASEYSPLELEGDEPEATIAFGRGDLVVVAPRWVTRVDPVRDATVVLPEGEWVDVLGGPAHRGGPCPLKDLLDEFPVSVLARPDV